MSAEPKLLDRRFVLVTGKGGVGKSTVTAMLAWASAAAGRRTLACELNKQERIAPALGHEPVGEQITRIHPNLWTVNINPKAALEEYGLMKLHIRALYRIVFENPLVEGFVRFIPGANELLMLGKTFNHERERDSHGQPVWDAIYIDAPATGHGLTLFHLPKVIRDTVASGNMHEEARAMWSLLTDPDRTAVHLVSLPEELAVQETHYLHARLVELGLPLGYVFLNMVPPRLLNLEQLELFRALGSSPPGDLELEAQWETTGIRLGRCAMATHYARSLTRLRQPLVQLPTQYTAEFGLPQIDALAKSVLAQVGRR